jgi:uncharacterized protein YkwD
VIFLATCVSCLIAFTSVSIIAGGREAEANGISYRFKRAERCLMRRINRVRARHGLRRFEDDRQLAYVARQHAVSMSGTGGVYHDPNISWKVTRWRRLGQNTGRGRSCRSLSNAFLHSSVHRQHILGHFRYLGIGTEKRGGRLYVQELFESKRDPGNVYHYP